MQLPIPQDWDGETWACYTVRWPSSEGWNSLLRGFITTPMRGRFWDGATGSIKEAQQIGIAILDANLPLTDCSGAVVPPGVETPCTPGGPSLTYNAIMEWLTYLEAYMLGSGPCPPIKIENGKLYFYSCCAWQEVGSIAENTNHELPDSPLDPGDGSSVTYYACGKADAAVTALQAVCDASWEAWNNPAWKWESLMEAPIPGYDLNGTKVVSAMMQSIAVHGLYDKADVMDTDLWQQLRYQTSRLLADDSAGMTAEQYEQFKGFIRTIWPSQADGWIIYCLDAIGSGSVRKITALAATNGTADCTAPAPEPDPDTLPTTPTAQGWYWSPVLPNASVYVPDISNNRVAFSWKTVKEVFAVRFDLQLDTSLNIKSMGTPAAAGLSSATANTSENWDGASHGGTYLNCFLHKETTFRDLIMGANVGYLFGGSASNFISVTPASPSAVGGSNVVAGYGICGTYNYPGWAHFTNIRLLHNINSAHGAL